MGHLKKADASMTDFASAWLTDGSVGLIAVFYGYLNLASSELIMGFKNFIKLVCLKAQKHLAPRFQAAQAQYQVMNGINGINGNFGSAATWMEKIAVRTGRTDIQTKNQFDECPSQNNVPCEHGYFQCLPGSSYPFCGMGLCSGVPFTTSWWKLESTIVNPHQQVSNCWSSKLNYMATITIKSGG